MILGFLSSPSLFENRASLNREKEEQFEQENADYQIRYPRTSQLLNRLRGAHCPQSLTTHLLPLTGTLSHGINDRTPRTAHQLVT